VSQINGISCHQMQTGDKFTGWYISLLNLTSANFATLPAFFEVNTDENWTQTTVHNIFPYLELADGVDRRLQMCLGSLVYHRKKVIAFKPVWEYPLSANDGYDGVTTLSL
jgi:hypothetical protein